MAISGVRRGRVAAPAQTVTNAPAGTRSLAETPFKLILPRQNLLGDWYGAHKWLEERGVTPTLTLLTDALGNPTGGRRQGFSEGNNVGLDLNVDLEKLGGLTGSSFQLSFSERFGASLSAKYIGNVFNVQAVNGEDTYPRGNVPYGQKLLDSRVHVQCRLCPPAPALRLTPTHLSILPHPISA